MSMPTHNHTPELLPLPRLSDDAVVQIPDFIHQILDLFEARYGDQIRRFYEDLGGDDNLTEPHTNQDICDPPF
jgi:hypothetical protein